MDFEYVYAKDVGRAVDIAATIAMPKPSIFNIGAGKVTTFDELAATAQKLLPKLEVEIIPGKPPANAVSQPLDISRAKEHLGWEPQYDMEKGFQDYINDLKAVIG